MLSAQQSLTPGERQLDAYAAASNVTPDDHMGNYDTPPRAFKLNIDSCFLLVKLTGDETAGSPGLKGFYHQGIDYPLAAINIQKYSGATPVALAPGDVTLIY